MNPYKGVKEFCYWGFIKDRSGSRNLSSPGSWKSLEWDLPLKVTEVIGIAKDR